MNSKALNVIKDTSYYLTNYFPVAFCMAVCFGFRASVGIIWGCLSVLLNPDFKSKHIMPLLISYLLLGFNPERAVFASLICGILLIISSFITEKLKQLFASPVISGVMLASALTVTVMFTTLYFGIGATGNNVTEMIKSYISLGFHPNWRGVLYGTIVLVLMITFPRKFKVFSKYVSASSVAIVFTLILNYFLNPADMVSAITEIPYSDTSWIKDYLISRTAVEFDLECVLIGISLFLVCFYSITENQNSCKNDFITSGIANIVTGGLIGLPLPYGINKNKNSIIPRTIAVLIIISVFTLFYDSLLRIPVHSCAVVLIISAWDSVKWKEIKESFSGIIPFIIFVISFGICLLTDMFYGIVFSAIISVLYVLLFKKNNYVKNLR